MTQFSGAVKLGDLNDFIAPSQACIVALEGARRPGRICAGVPSDLKGATRRRRSRTSLTHVRPSLPSHAANKDGKLNLEDDIDVPRGGRDDPQQALQGAHANTRGHDVPLRPDTDDK